MESIERRVAGEVKAMSRKEVIVKTIAGELTWIQAADILGITARHLRRLKQRWERHGYDGLVDYRGGKPRRTRIALATIEQVCTLKRQRYPDFSVQHFWEQLGPVHGLEISYTWTRSWPCRQPGSWPGVRGRGQYRRRRERRPLCGMMVHLDASRHGWLPQLPMQDLVVAMDDADGRILYARFVPEENTASTLAALKHLLRRYGRFAELYTDRASHFCYTPKAGTAPTTEHGGAVSRALKVLGIRQLLAWSPQARGRSERAFGTSPGPLAAGAAGGGEWQLRARQHLPRAGLCARLQPALHGAPGAARPGLPAAGGSRSGVAALRTARPHGAKRQHGELQEPGAPTAAHPRAGALRALPGHRARVSRGRIGDSATRGGCWAATRPTGNCSTCRQPRAPSGENPHDLVQRDTRVVLVASFLGHPRASPRRRWPENGTARASPLALRARCVSLAYHHPVPPPNRRCPVQPERTSLTANDPHLCTCQ